jgi:HK97 family phage major capsid protein
MPEDPKNTPQAKTMQEVTEAITAIQESVKKFGTDNAEFKTLQEKVEAALVDFDNKNQELVLEQQKALKEEGEKREALDQQIKDLEIEVAKGSNVPGQSYKEMAEYKALTNWFRFGDGGVSADEAKLLVPANQHPEHKTLRTDIATGAGYLTFPEFDTEIIKQIVEISPMRSVARVKSVGSKTLTGPTRTSIPTAAYEGEAELGTDSQSAYGNETLTAHRLTFTTPFTRDQLADSRFDLMTEIQSDAMEAFAQREGNRFVLGTGVKQPEGFTVNAAVVAGATTSTVTGSLAAIDLITLSGALKVGYNPIYTMNRQALAVIRGLQDGSGAFIFQAGQGRNDGQAGSIPATIAGFPYVIMQDMASFANGSLSVAFGDFTRGYRIIDFIGMEMIRDEFTNKKNAIIEVTFHRYNDGQVILAEAIKLLLTKS